MHRLGHAHTHGEPFTFKVFLRECLVFFHVHTLVHTLVDSVLGTFTQFVERVGYLTQVQHRRSPLFPSSSKGRAGVVCPTLSQLLILYYCLRLWGGRCRYNGGGGHGRHRDGRGGGSLGGYLWSRLFPGCGHQFLEQGFQSSCRAAPRTDTVVLLRYLRYLNERQLHQQPFVATLAVVHVAAVRQPQRLVEETVGTTLGLFLVTLAVTLARLQQLHGSLVLGHHHVADVCRQTVHQMTAVEPFGYHVVQQQHHLTHLVVDTQVHYLEVVFSIEHVQVLYHLGVGEVILAETGALVEYRQGVAHAAICFFGDDV